MEKPVVDHSNVSNKNECNLSPQEAPKVVWRFSICDTDNGNIDVGKATLIVQFALLVKKHSIYLKC